MVNIILIFITFEWQNPCFQIDFTIIISDHFLGIFLLYKYSGCAFNSKTIYYRVSIIVTIVTIQGIHLYIMVTKVTKLLKMGVKLCIESQGAQRFYY